MNITDKIILNETASIKEAIQIIDDNSIKIVLVVEGNKKLIVRLLFQILCQACLGQV